MEFHPKKVICRNSSPDYPPVLGLEMKDKNGVEYHDGDILRIYWKIDKTKYPMIGMIRYFGGRFEIVCSWFHGAENFTVGLNRDHEILGHVYNDDALLTEQLQKRFTMEDGIPA